jgi:putative transcriptional regulator
MDMKGLRQKARVKAEEVVYKLGISMSTLRNWEQGRTIPTLNPIQYAELLNLYSCTPDELAAAVRDKDVKP